MSKIWQLLSSILILVCNINSIKIDNQSQIEINSDNFKTNDDKTNINNIHFYNEIINLDYPNDYDVKPVDDATLNQFLTNENYNLLIPIYSQNESIKGKKQNLIIMTSISTLVISFLIIIIFLKARLKKGIGIKKNKNGKNSYYSTKNKNKMKKSEENNIIELSLEKKHIIKMNNKIKKRKNKTKKARKKKKKNYYQI